MTAKNLENSKNQAFDPAASVFVSANAGAGKTSLLAGRVLSLLLHGVEPSKILCLTFTKAAAGEMMGRVLSTLSQWVMCSEEELAEKLAAILGAPPEPWLTARARTLFAKVLEAPEGLRIQTIHGFCQSLLGRFPIEAGVSPHFSVMDGRTEQELLSEARIRLFNHARSGHERLQPALYRLAHELSETGLSSLIGEIIAGKRKFSSLFAQSNIDVLMREVWRRLEAKPQDSFASLAKEHFVYNDAQLVSLRLAARTLIELGGKTDLQTGEALAAFFSGDIHAPERIGEYARAYLTEKGTPRKTMFTKALKDESLVAALMAERERVLAFHKAWSAHQVAAHTVDVLCIAEALLSIYEAIKRAHAQMDYDDLILTACRLLQQDGVAPWVLFKLDGGIDHILVDEAQDTSAEQWQIIDALTEEFFAGSGRREGERSLFVVGDEKQSIYSFQGADPSALGRKQQLFKSRIEAADRPVHTVELKRSFRSAAEVLAVVDAIFAQEDARRGLMFSDAALAHTPTKTFKGLVEVWPLTQPQEEGEYRVSAGTMLARQIAGTIRKWLETGEKLSSQDRAIRAGDIMVLVRTRTSFVDKLTRMLKKYGVPVAGHDRMELGENLAVQDLVALGQVLLLPEDDLTLAALLKSPIFNVSEEGLFELAHGRGKHSMWDRLQALSSMRGELAQALLLLEDLRSRADYIAPYELYAYLLDTCGARHRFTGRMGQEYSDPIDEFLNQALLYESAHAPSLQGFIHWLSSSQSQIKRDMEQAHNAVRIMTIHGAKGLQAPIVFLPDTTELPKLRESLLWHDDDGVALPLRAPSVAEMDEKSSAVRAGMREAMLAEYRRLLYVALTRAEERIYVCGVLTRGEAASEESWYHFVRSGMRPTANAFEMESGQGLRIGEAALGRAAPEKREQAEAAKIIPFLVQPAPQEPAPPKPLSPSRMEGVEPAGASPLADAGAYQRGNIIHLLLQHLPQVEEGKREEAARRIASLRSHGLPQEVVDDSIREVLAVLRDARFAFLFAEGSLAEVPVAGCVPMGGGVVAVSGQIDRLSIGERDVWIVDFKSNRNPPAPGQSVPSAYARQLRLYQLVLQAIYPGKTIRCALLWTMTAELTVLDEALLATYI